MYVYFGIVAGGLGALGSGSAGPTLGQKIAIWVVSGVIIIVVAVVLTIFAKRAIAKAIQESKANRSKDADVQSEETEKLTSPEDS